MTSTFTEILYSCGHQEGEGGSVSDPRGLLAKVRNYKTSTELCSVCKDPKKYPYITNPYLTNS